MNIRPYQNNDEAQVVQLWYDCGLVVSHNNPKRDIQRKLKVNAEWFLVGELDGKIVATCMVGYEGHRGWINYLAVTPGLQRKGLASQIMQHAEGLLRAAGCPKINLQIRASNLKVIEFYKTIGYKMDDVVCMGKRLEVDEPHKAAQPGVPALFPRQLLLIWLFSLFISLCTTACCASEPLGKVPGTVIAASPDFRTEFYGSPSIAILSNGCYIVSYDLGGSNPRAGRTIICSSRDRGNTWTHVADIPGQHWSTVFTHRGALWLFGVSCKSGRIQIRRSIDEGRTWTTPGDAETGLLAVDGKFHCGPTPVLVHQGRVWRAFEEFAPTGNRRVFRAFMLSAPENADLLVATNWTRSSSIACKAEWLNVRTPSWLEGNAVVTPAGTVVDILRVESHPATGASWDLPGLAHKIPRFEVAAMLEISADGREAGFDPARGFIHFIGSESKFTIRYDPVSRRYWSLVNKITNLRSGSDFTHSPHHQRNVIALTSSADLSDWQEHFRLLRYAEGSVVVKADSRVGFQYLDWQFDGEDIIAASRTSWNGINYHDANYITFHRLKKFRTVAIENSPPDLIQSNTK